MTKKTSRLACGAMRIARMFAGVVLVLVGCAGLVLPVIPGVVLIFLGLSLLGCKHVTEWATALRKRFARKK